MTKTKLINDPVHGFIRIGHPLIFEIIEHPYFQRLRRISQMGMAHFVYPGTQHTRFHHAIGAMHLMQKALFTLKSKGVIISEEEELGALLAILLHDIGHGPFSHALENVMTEEINHEFFSSLLMHKLNHQCNEQLDVAIAMFSNDYHRPFFHQLVSSQLDVDRLDYLARDSFFSGVYEGKISTERIISMLDVEHNEIVVEEKGIYSIEKYLISRRLMYWQVYLHKTAIAVEFMTVQLIKRAKYLANLNQLSVSSKPLHYILSKTFTKDEIVKSSELLNAYVQLDDHDIMFAIKEWQHSDDHILSSLAKRIIQRKLFQIKVKNKPFSEQQIIDKKEEIQQKYNVTNEEVNYYCLHGKIGHKTYEKGKNGIKIKLKSGKTKDIWKLSDQLKNKALIEYQQKFYLAWPK